MSRIADFVASLTPDELDELRDLLGGSRAETHYMARALATLKDIHAAAKLDDPRALILDFVDEVLDEFDLADRDKLESAAIGNNRDLHKLSNKFRGGRFSRPPRKPESD